MYEITALINTGSLAAMTERILVSCSEYSTVVGPHGG